MNVNSTIIEMPVRRGDAIASTSFPLWGGQAIVATARRDGLSPALAAVKRVVSEFDAACSSFRDDSELTLLNRSPGEALVVSELLFTAVQAALRAARLTDGAVDPTVGQALIAHRINPPLWNGGRLGYSASAPVTATRYASIPTAMAGTATGRDGRRPLRIAPVPGYGAVRTDAENRTITLPAGVTLDLGSTAKALAADMAAQAAEQAAGCGVLVSLLGDVAVSGEAPGPGWTVRVTDDHQHEDGPGQTVTIHEGGLTTSSVTVRQHEGSAGPVHHLIDPSTGHPARGPWRTASVTAGSCLDANIASTAAIVLGDRAVQWLDDHCVPSRLVRHDGSVRYAAGWPAVGDELCAA